jgi:signal transduction histidine kinase
LGVQGIGYITRGVSLGHDRKDKAIVTYLEPEEPITNKAMIGYDMRTDPSLRVALDLARDTGSVSASSKINDKLFMFIPLYFGGVVPTSLAERHALIQGYIYSPFRAEDLLHNIVITDTLQTVDFQIYDGSQSDKQHLLYNSLTKTNELSNEAPLFHATNKVSIGGRIWMIVFSTNSKFGIASQHQLPATIFLGGLLISLMFFLLSRSQYLARNHLEHTTAKLQASKEDLQKAIGMRDNFISAASHELKTPVTSMKVYAEVLLKQFQKSENTKAMQQLGKINKQIDKLMLLIHDLLDVTRLNSGHLSLHVEQFDMNILLTEIVEATQ